MTDKKYTIYKIIIIQVTLLLIYNNKRALLYNSLYYEIIK